MAYAQFHAEIAFLLGELNTLLERTNAEKVGDELSMLRPYIESVQVSLEGSPAGRIFLEGDFYLYEEQDDNVPDKGSRGPA